jgi:two-component system response regulator TctD
MRILVIEDSADVGFAICERLRKSGHIVEHCLDGNEGEDFALQGAFDVVILDINLPGKDGFEILASIRKVQRTLPVLVLTARNQVGDKVNLLDLGADDYMVKPFSMEELEARLRAVSRRHLGAVKSTIDVGALSLDTANGSVSLSGELLDLGHREYELLSLLITQFDTAVRKGYLVAKLFGHDDVGSPNAIELLVSRLRKKLDGSGFEIATIRGVGYALRQHDQD